MGALRRLHRLHEEGPHWTLVHTHAGDVTVCVEPFEALPLELGVLWERDE